MIKHPLRPLSDHVLVRREEAAKETKGGIVLPDVSQEMPRQGTVLAAGPGVLRDDGTFCPVAVSVGDTVLFGWRGGQEVEWDGEKLLILREEEILGVVQE